MNGDELLKRLAAIKEPSNFTLSPGPFTVRVSEHDAIAAELLQWLSERLGEEATLGDAEDVLLVTLWWQTFLAAIPKNEVTEP